jgi:hypothetical protein
MSPGIFGCQSSLEILVFWGAVLDFPPKIYVSIHAWTARTGKDEGRSRARSLFGFFTSLDFIFKSTFFFHVNRHALLTTIRVFFLYVAANNGGKEKMDLSRYTIKKASRFYRCALH